MSLIGAGFTLPVEKLFHSHGLEVPGVLFKPNLTAASILKSVAATCEHDSPSL